MDTKEPIRIAHVIGQMINGGVEAVVFNYYRHIDKTKYQFDFFYDTDSTMEPSQELIDMGARFYLIPAYKNVGEYTRELIRLFKENDYQIVHSHMNTLSVFTLRAAKKAGVPIRITHNHSTLGKGETKKNIMKYVLRPFAKVYPTHLAACSRYAGEWIYGKNTEFKVFNNAIEVKKYKYDPRVREEYRNKLGLTDEFVIGHIGRFCYQKNQSFLVDIFAEYQKVNPKSKLLLIGDGEDLEMVRQKVQKLNLQEKVIFLGSITDAYRYYQVMDVFVLPSRYEGLPVVGVESQIAGLSCLFSNAMTKDTKFSPSALFIDKDSTVSEWIMRIEDSKGNSRMTDEEVMLKSGFDIRYEVGKLEQYYKYNLDL